jgi:hypothetical protein
LIIHQIKMSSFEVIGVVLGVWPVVLNALSVFTATKDGRGARLLLNELRTEELVYREFVKQLLASDVSEADLLQLSDGKRPNLDLWKDKALNCTLERRLGDKSEFVLKTLEEMKNILEGLNEKLGANVTVVV